MRRKLIRGVKWLLLLWAAVFLWLFAAGTTTKAVQEKLAQLTGARVELGSAERLWFGPGVRLQRLALEGKGYQFQGDQLEVRFAALPLLFGEARPKSVQSSDARLRLTGEGSAGDALGGLPLNASWSITRLTIQGQWSGEERELLYLDSARLDWFSTGGAELTLTGGAGSLNPASLRLQGSVRRLSANAFPEGTLQIEFADFPAQPLLGFFTGDRRALRTAKLEGRASVDSKPEQGTAAGRLVATTPAHKLLEAEFLITATPERLQLQSARGELAGNGFEAGGGIDRWLSSDRQTDISVRLPQARLRSDTLDILHEALGREALGFAENLRGGFSAELQFRPGARRSPLTGKIELEGMNYTPDGLPALENLRGGLRLDGTSIRFAGVTGRLLETPARLSGEVHGMQVALQLDTEGIPLTNLPWVKGAELPVENLTGQVHVQAKIGGRAVAPEVSGIARLSEAGLDFLGVEVRGVEGEVEFNLIGARAGSLRGLAGGCAIELAAAARFAHWRDSTSATLRMPECELAELARLGESAGVLKPGLVEADSLAGQGSLLLELDGRQWRGELLAEDARWSPGWLPQPLERGSLRARLSPEGVELQQARAQLGASSLSARGRFPVGEQRNGPWEVEVQSCLAAEDALALLPESWRGWIVLSGPLEGQAVFSGGDASSVTVEARLQSVPEGIEVAGMPATVPRAAPHRLELRGTVSADSFALRELTAHVGEAQVRATGQVPLDRSGEIDVRITAPDSTPLPDLLSLVRVPEILGPVEGALAADLRLEGTWAAPAWSGDIELESVRLPKLLTEPVQLWGGVRVSSNGFELRGIEVVQPHGAFKVSGQLRREGTSELELAGAWANLDRLLGQLPGGHWSHPESGFWVRHPTRVAIAIEEVELFGAVFSDVRGELRQEEGRLQLYLPDFAFGKGKGDLFAETYPERHELLVRLALDQISTESFLTELLNMDAGVSGSLSVDAELTGPLGSREEFVRGARGELNFKIPQGRLQRGTLPERLFAVAVLLNEGVYGFGLNRLARIFKPTGLRRFRDWSGTVELEEGKARIVESTLSARVYDVTLSGELDLPSGTFQMHGDGNFHPGWEFDISLQAIVNLFARAFQLARGKRNTSFEFDVAGEIGGSKRVQNFRFK